VYKYVGFNELVNCKSKGVKTNLESLSIEIFFEESVVYKPIRFISEFGNS
jgi:hypothetical protein